MRFLYLFLLIFLLHSCSKDKETCYTIEGKEIVNGEYFFLLNRTFDYQAIRSSESSGIPDPYGSGKVDEDTYNSVDIGDKYCQ
tara:strand:- start:189 stop:437 length:249 start_codon:yes stop_codon:yes gene_type:complete